mgnify:CR=1 FL=1
MAPLAYAEDFDNVGLLVGNQEEEITGILVCHDALESVIDEAIHKKCNLVVSFHPILFSGIKKITGKNYVERAVMKAIKNDIAIYAIHTNLDHVATGVNKKIADRLGLTKTQILQPKKQLLSKLEFFVPIKDKDQVLQAIFEAGAGHIGEYKDCSFQVEGLGTYTASEKANPHLGERGIPHQEPETRIEVILPSHLGGKIIQAMKKNHPYEEVAYFLTTLENVHQEVGAGMIGELPAELSGDDFLSHLKSAMNLQIIKHTALINRPIKRVAVCGGAGIFLLADAKRASADAFVTSDIKYHEYFDAEGQLVLCDIGHYESEIFTKDLLAEFLSQNFPNIALYLTKVVTNPTSYR